jgi:RimJ/RimL family protein N-acetyltransferase
VTTIFSSKPTLRGELVTLRPIVADDADVIARIIREDPEVSILTGSIHTSTEQLDPGSIEQLRAIYERWSTAEDRLVLAVIDNRSAEMVGEVVLNDWDEGNQSCGFRTLVGAAGRGRGLGTEATRLTAEYGLRVLNLHRISLEVYDFNPRARYVYTKVGFRQEGTGREALLFDGRWIDVHFMAILASDLH